MLISLLVQEELAEVKSDLKKKEGNLLNKEKEIASLKEGLYIFTETVLVPLNIPFPRIWNWVVR